MSDPIYHHERLYRSAEVMERLARLAVTVCGAGALGANIAESLARTGFRRLRLIDRDRVEERNLSTQPYLRGDVGAFKAKVLAGILYRAVGVEVDARVEDLTEPNAGKLVAGSGLVIDCFDNAAARDAVTETCRRMDLPCLHAGLAAGYAEVLWNEVYRVPTGARDDLCDYPLARNLVTLTVAVACEAVIAFTATGERRNRTVTLGDLSVRAFPV